MDLSMKNPEIRGLMLHGCLGSPLMLLVMWYLLKIQESLYGALAMSVLWLIYNIFLLRRYRNLHARIIGTILRGFLAAATQSDDQGKKQEASNS